MRGGGAKEISVVPDVYHDDHGRRDLPVWMALWETAGGLGKKRTAKMSKGAWIMREEPRVLLGEAPVRHALWKMSVPSIFGIMAYNLYHVSDTIFISQGAGTAAVGGVSVSFPQKHTMKGSLPKMIPTSWVIPVSSPVLWATSGSSSRAFR